jgi:molybdopterin-synthase adenylyltransferase
VEGRLGDPAAAPAGAAGRRPYSLRSSVEPLRTADGELFLLRSGEEDLHIRGAEPADHALVMALADGPAPVAALVAATGLDPERLDAKLRALAAAGVLTEQAPSAPLDALDAARFDRQLPYLAESGDPHALQRRLRAATVLVLGCGGLGTWALAALASAGVGTFVLVDDDVVERSNLNRQILYGEADLDAPKVDAAARWLRGFDGRIAVRTVRRRVTGAADVAVLAGAADVVVMAADWPPYALARWVNAACVEAGVPFALAGQAPPIVKIGPIYWPGRSACFACHERALRDASPYYDDYVAQAQRSAPHSATLGPASGLVGAALGMELVHLLIGRRPATLGAAITLDLRTFATNRTEIPLAAGCEACQHLHDGRGTG